MKKLLTLLALLLATPCFAMAQLTTTQGGTGTTSPSGLLYGDGTLHLKTVTIGSNITFSGGVLSATGGGSGGTGAATSSFAALFPLALLTSASTIQYSFSGLATTSPWTVGNLAYVADNNHITSVATTSATCSGTVSCTSFSIIGSSPVTISGSGGGSGTGNVSTSAVPTIGQLAFWTTSGNTPEKLGTVATGIVSAGSSAITVTAGRSVIGGALSIDCATATGSQNGCLSSTDWSTFNSKQATIGVSWPITLSGATVGYNGLSTTSPWTNGNLAMVTDGNHVTSVATSSASCSGGVSCSSFTVVGTVSPSITASFANPSTNITLSTNNGSASTAMRSDGAPALSQAIAPTWTALHIFSANASSTLFSIYGGTLPTLWVGGTATSSVVGDSATSSLISSLLVKKTSGTALTVADQYGTANMTMSTASTTAGYDLLQLWSATSSGPLFGVDQYGHVYASSTPPVLSSCGTTPTLSSDSSDFGGTITVGSVSATGCTLTFGTAHTTGTHCVISNQSSSVTNAMTYTESVSGFVVSQTGLTSAKLDYLCTGK